MKCLATRVVQLLGLLLLAAGHGEGAGESDGRGQSLRGGSVAAEAIVEAVGRAVGEKLSLMDDKSQSAVLDGLRQKLEKAGSELHPADKDGAAASGRAVGKAVGRGIKEEAVGAAVGRGIKEEAVGAAVGRGIKEEAVGRGIKEEAIGRGIKEDRGEAIGRGIKEDRGSPSDGAVSKNSEAPLEEQYNSEKVEYAAEAVFALFSDMLDKLTFEDQKVEVHDAADTFSRVSAAELSEFGGMDLDVLFTEGGEAEPSAAGEGAFVRSVTAVLESATAQAMRTLSMREREALLERLAGHFDRLGKSCAKGGPPPTDQYPAGRANIYWTIIDGKIGMVRYP